MAVQTRNSRIYPVAACFTALLLTACGSANKSPQSNNSTAPHSPTSSVAAVSASCTPAAVEPRATSQCSAAVQGTGAYSSAVSWSASGGKINASGLFTAPASSGNVTITATSTQNRDKSGAVSLKVQPPASAPTSPSSAISSVSVACSPASLATGAKSRCKATVHGSGSYSSGVHWSASAGTISTSGLFTAPASGGNVAITASSTQTPAKSGTVSLKVQAPARSSTVSSVSVVCAPASLATNAKSQCTATVQGTGNYSSAVTWKANTGAISSSGLFTAPASAATAAITATSIQNTSKRGTASIAIEAQSTAPTSKHVVMVMEENSSYSTIVGNSNWPSLNSLIRNGALATKYYANVHPSIGNYFMLTTGQVLTTDDSSTRVWNVANIARSMLAAGVSFRIYAEAIPGPGYLGGNTGPYLIRHQPFAMLSDLANNQKLADQHIFPFSQFATDVANGNLPAFSFIVPDVNDDAHNGTPQQADSWLQTKVVSPLSNDSAFQPGGNGVLIVDFDEALDSDTTHGGGHVPAVFWGPAVKTGYTQASGTVYQHPSMLRTIMQYLGLSNPPGAAGSAPPMTEFFVK